ncbi:unnamed protein product, partial [Didymodactylos carnosus]
LIDGHDIRDLNIQWLRSQIGLVNQEPVLFDLTIRENIAYGNHSGQSVYIQEIIDVAKKANIHDFIQKLPQGYETNVGARGTQLSGGEKQRIAIARVLFHDPKVLLLDEATSAMDAQNEKIVQQALDQAQQKRTTIIVAHRLSTIQNCDLICVMDPKSRRIIEHGKHSDLIQQRGIYYKLVVGE